MIEWHPYPKELPPILDRDYLLTVTAEAAAEFDLPNEPWDVARWEGELWENYKHSEVLAWAEITPYKPQNVQNKAQNKGIIAHAGRKLRLPIKRIEK